MQCVFSRATANATPGGGFTARTFISGTPQIFWFVFREVRISSCRGFDQELVAVFAWPLPYGALSVYRRTHMLRCLTVVVFPLRGLKAPALRGDIKGPHLQLSVLGLRHGSNHSGSGVSAPGQDRNTTDWRRLQRKAIHWQTVVLSGELWIP